MSVAISTDSRGAVAVVLAALEVIRKHLVAVASAIAANTTKLCAGGYFVLSVIVLREGS